MESSAAIELTTSPYTIISFAAYILVILLIGVFSSRFSSKGISEFFLGGRKMNRFVVALSAVASGRSSWLLLGLTGIAYLRGLSAIWAAAGYVTVEFFMFLYAAPRLRTLTGEADDLTISDYFVSRSGDKTNLLRLLSAVIIIIFMTAYISAQFVGGGKAFAASFQIPELSGIILTAVIVLLYTLLGGFLAVSLTDVLQALFMLFAIFVLPIVAITDFGGWHEMIAALQVHDAAFVDPFAISVGALIGFVGIGLGSPGNPHILVRYMSIDDPAKLRFSGYVGTFWNIVMAASAVVIGLTGRAYFPENAMLPNGDPEYIFPYLSQLHLHPALFGIITAAILAAIMSTADSMLLVSASAVIRDIYQRTLKKNAELTDRQLVLLSRAIIIVLVLAAFIIGITASDLVFWLVLFAWGGLGAAFGPPLLLSLFWRGTSRNGIAAGFVTGMLTTIIWNQTPALKSFVYELVPAFILSTAATVMFSLLERNSSKQ